MNNEILELQRDLLLDQLLEVENQMYNQGMKRNTKGYSLFLRNGVFYVKYTDLKTGKQIPTNRSLRTSNRKEADKLAEKYRNSFIRSYYDRKNKIKNLPKFFSEYYQLEKSTYLQEVLKTKQRKIGKKQIGLFNGFVNNYFVPFLNEKKVKRLNELTIDKLKEFQSFLVEKGLNPNTINDRFDGAIKPIFTNLFLKGVIKATPFTNNLDFRFNLPEREAHNRRHTLPIYETMAVLMDTEMWKLYKTKEDIKHNKVANEKHYKKYRLICLLMATCGLRNAEIFMLRKKNIIPIRRTWFLDVVNSRIEEQGLKTENSKRKVPIPTITLKALNEYIAENNITDYLFYSGSKTIHYNMFSYACNQFGTHCGYTEKELEEKNFVMYSFRHFYNTMLDTSNIKEIIIRYFMGHSVDIHKMGENYNNREDLDEEFFEENGLKVIEYINDLCKKVIAKYELLPIHTHTEQVSLTDNKGNKKAYYTDVLNDLDFENETRLFMEDLQEKELLPSTNNKQNLIDGLKQLYENGNIDKRRYDDCIFYVNNMKIEP
jgi:integrase